MTYQPKGTTRERYSRIRGEHRTLSASQALLWAKSEQRQAQVFGRYGLDFEPNCAGDESIAVVELPDNDEPATLEDWANVQAPLDYPEPSYIARVRMIYNECDGSLLDGIGEFASTPEYHRHYHTRPRSYNREHEGTKTRDCDWDYFTPDCNPWEERYAWGGCKHDRFLKACECAKGQWEYAEKVARGDVYSVGYVVEVWSTDDIDWDDGGQCWDFDSAEPISEDSCWGFDGSTDDKETDVWDMLLEVWGGAREETENRASEANQNVATKG